MHLKNFKHKQLNSASDLFYLFIFMIVITNLVAIQILALVLPIFRQNKYKKTYKNTIDAHKIKA